MYQSCRWVRPGGGEFYPYDGLALGRYSYYGKGVFKGYCGISIRKPLTEADKGAWRCELTTLTEKEQPYGAYVEVGIPRRTRDEKVSTLRKWTGTWKKGGEELAVAVAGQPLTLGCSLYASLSFCQIIHPNGTRIEPSKDSPVVSYGRGRDLGDCGITVLNASVKDSGIWKCAVGVDYGEAAVASIDVQVYESELDAMNLDSVHSTGVTLQCKSVFGLALEHCRFQRPDHTMFTVAQVGSPDVAKMVSETGIRTVGNMAAGICSVILSTVRSSDIGEWACIGRIAGQNREVAARFTLRTDGVAVASASTISAIVVVVFVVLAIGGALWAKSRRNRRDGLLAGVARGQQQQQVPQVSFRRSSDDDDA